MSHRAAAEKAKTATHGTPKTECAASRKEPHNQDVPLGLTPARPVRRLPSLARDTPSFCRLCSRQNTPSRGSIWRCSVFQRQERGCWVEKAGRGLTDMVPRRMSAGRRWWGLEHRRNGTCPVDVEKKTGLRPFGPVMTSPLASPCLPSLARALARARGPLRMRLACLLAFFPLPPLRLSSLTREGDSDGSG